MVKNIQDKSQIKIGVVLSYVQIGLNMIIQLAYTPIMIRLLGKSEYGLYNLVGSVVSYLSLFSLGFTGAYLRFSSIKKKTCDQSEIASFNGMFLSLFLLLGAIALICGLTLSLFSDQIFGNELSAHELSTAKTLMIILVINVAMSFPSSVFNSMITAEECFLFQRLVTLIGTLANPMVTLPLLLAGYGSVAVVLVTTIITIFQLCFNMIYCFVRIKVPICFKNFDMSLLKEMGVFSFFIFLNMVVNQANWSVDKIILGRELGTDSVAEYGVGSQINSMIINFSTAISSVFAPQINRIAVNSEHKERDFTNLFIKVGRIQFMVVFLVTSGFIFFGRYFINNIYAGKGYEVSYYVALCLIIPELVPLIQNTGIEIQRSVNKHKFRSVVYSIMALINIVISIFLARAYGPVGAALGTSISLILMNIIAMNIYYEKSIGIGIKEFWGNIISLFKVLLPAMLVGLIMMYCQFKYEISIVFYILFIMLYSLIYFVLLFKFGMNANEKGYVKEILRKFHVGCRA